MEWGLVSRMVNRSKRLVLPGFDRLPFYDVARFFVKGLQKTDMLNNASSVAFNFFIAIFPAILTLFTFIPYLPIENFQETLLDLIDHVFPNNTYEAVRLTLEDIIKRPRGGLLSFGFVMALYFSTNGIDSLILAFNINYHTMESRSFFKRKLISLFLVVVLSVLIIVAIALITFGTFALDYLLSHDLIHGGLSTFLIQAGKWLVILASIFFGISFIYYFAPASRKDFRFISAGSTLATVLILVASIGFNYYVSNFAQYNALYGSIGTLLIILLWIYFNAFILLIGFELNASIYHARSDMERIVPIRSGPDEASSTQSVN